MKVNLLVVRHHVNSWHQRLLAKPPHQLEVSKSPTDISQVGIVTSSFITVQVFNTHQVLLLSVKFDVIRSLPSCSSVNFHSNAWFVKLRKTSNPIFASNHLPSALFRNPLRLTSYPCLRTPTFAPSTLSVLLFVSFKTFFVQRCH